MEPIKTMTEWAADREEERRRRDEEERTLQIALDAMGVSIREYYKARGNHAVNFKTEPPRGIAILDSEGHRKFVIKCDEGRSSFTLTVLDVANAVASIEMEKRPELSIEEVYDAIDRCIGS